MHAHPTSEHKILPVDHAFTRLYGGLKQMTVQMKNLLRTVLLPRPAGFIARWEAAGGAWRVRPASCRLPLLDGTGEAIQPQPPSLPGHRDVAAGCFEIHVCTPQAYGTLSFVTKSFSIYLVILRRDSRPETSPCKYNTTPAMWDHRGCPRLSSCNAWSQQRDLA